jgi:putative ABC transport system substrate-binding protein
MPHELAPPGRLGVLLNQKRLDGDVHLKAIQAAARSVGRETIVAYASTVPEIDAAFAMLKEKNIAGLLLGRCVLHVATEQIIVLTTRHGWPAIYQWREFTDAGGLASYGTEPVRLLSAVGLFAARILKGEKPADLPVW